MGPITSPYEQPTPVKDLNQYATLKAVGKLFARSHNDDKAYSILFD